MEVLAQMNPSISSAVINPSITPVAAGMNPPPSITPLSPPDPNLSCDPGSAIPDTSHQERMEYIRQLVQEREALASTPGTENARRLLEQGRPKIILNTLSISYFQ